MRKIILLFVLLFLFSMLFSGCIENDPHIYKEIVCGTVESVEGHTIHFKNDSYSGIIKEDGSIIWDGSLWNKNQFVDNLYIDNLNGYNLSWLPGYFIEMRIGSIMEENGNLNSTIISIYMDKK